MALRRTVAAASVALAAIALAGCSASGSNAPSFPPIEQPSPTKSVGMPTDLQAWAAVALPEDKTGGATFVARDIGAVTATQGAQVSIGQAAGT
ncbi:MAG: hypothetical protein KKH75_06480, partial [Actinobacteria bacterium]|nr:hypothetical protein [Actinomycetota bacterium]